VTIGLRSGIEKLVKDTRSELTGLADFIGIPAEREWLDKACNLASLVAWEQRPAQLDRDEFAALRAICARFVRN
jgi:hypothetical protein